MKLWSLALIFSFFSAFPLYGSEDPKQEKRKVNIASSVDLRFWGRVHFNTHYDTDDLRGFTDFATYLIDEGGSELNFNPRDTRFGFSASSKAGRWDASAVVEIDFYGSSQGNNLIPRLRMGYVELKDRHGWNLRIGQDWIPIAQQMPGTVDFGVLSWGGNLWWRVPQVTLRKKKGSFEWLVSLMKHRISNSVESQEKMPWAVGRIAYAEDGAMVALGAAWRSVEIDSPVDLPGLPGVETILENVEYEPWLIALEWRSRLGAQVEVFGEAWIGAGFATEFTRYGLDYNPIRGDEIDSNGGFAALAWRPNPIWRFHVGAGVDQPKDRDLLDRAGTPIPTAPFFENQVAFFNVRRRLSRQLGAGAEVMRFRTEQTSGRTIDGWRYTLGCWFVF